MTALWAGLALGVAGSGHCAGMCGPLVLVANPRAGEGGRGATLGLHVALYHAGRVSTYVLLGLVAGGAGGIIAGAGLGRVLALAAGVVLIVTALRGAGLPGTTGQGVLARAIAGALGRAGQWMRRHRLTGPFAFGAVNGLLPCGLVYAAVTAAAGLGNPSEALLFMAGFGLGSVPMLAAIALSGKGLAAMLPRRIRRIAPIAVAVAGLLLVVRGVSGPHVHPAPGTQTAPSAGTHAHH
jgi:sulfite exporter TauE/SafE